VKGQHVHVILDRCSQKIIFSSEAAKILKLKIVDHAQPYPLGWMQKGQDVFVKNQYDVPYELQLM